MNRKILAFYIVILVVAVLLRFYQLQSIPPGVNRDEASIGFTAYSLLKTGSDEYGRHFPLSFQSFGDWKLPLYIYLVIPLVWIFGLTEFAVRFPSAFFGTTTVALVYFLVRDMFKNNSLALISMALLAVSPWHIHLSRVESESNSAVLLVTLGLIFFLDGVRRKNSLLIASSFFFALTYFTYAGNHVFTTLLLLGIILFYKKEIPKTKSTLIAMCIFLVFFGIIVSQTLVGASKTKISGIGIFGDPSIIHAKIELPRLEHPNPNSLFSRVIHNRVIFGSERFFQNYVMAFSPEFLFIEGGINKAHNIENFGNMYLVEAPFLLFGFFYLLQLKKSPEKNIVLWWFLVSPLAASITKDAPHSNRMFAIHPILSLIVAMGVYYSFLKLKSIVSNKILYILSCFAGMLFVINIGIYIDRYFVHFPRNEAIHWGIGWKTLGEVLRDKNYENRKVIIGRPENSPYIFLAFYQKTDPIFFQQTVQRYSPTQDSFVHVKKFGKYEFKEINWSSDLQDSSKIIVSFPQDVPQNIIDSKSHISVLLPNGKPMFYLFGSL